MWTKFFDMHSGGCVKVPPYEIIYIEAESENEAIEIFETRFDRDPFNITCDCCGNDYSLSEYDTLEEATEYDRRYKNLVTTRKIPIPLSEYVNSDDILIIKSPRSSTG